jgi:hypothetical protein
MSNELWAMSCELALLRFQALVAHYLLLITRCSLLVARCVQFGAARFATPISFRLTPLDWGKVQRSARRRLALFIGESCRLLKYFDKHFSRQLAGLRVLI